MLGRRRRGDGSSVLANTAFGFLSQLTTAAFTTVLTLYLVRAFGPSEYGIFSLALSIGAIVLMFSDFGLAWSASRFMAEDIEDVDRIRRIANTALRLKLIGALGTGVLLFAVSPLIASVYGKPSLDWPLRWTAVSLVFESLLMLYTTAFGTLRRTSLVARTIFFESLLEATASIALVAVGAGAAGAVAGRALGYAAGAVIAVALLARILGRPTITRRQTEPELGREIIAYAKPLLLINGAYTLYLYTDALLIGALLTSQDVGEFTAPLRLVVLAGYLGQAIGSAIAPRMAGAAPDLPAFLGGLRILIIFQVFVVAGLVAWAEPIVDLILGPDYELAGKVLRGLAPYAFLMGIGPLASMTVTFIGGARQRVPIVVGALVVNVVLDLLLLPRMGVQGACVGTGVAFAIYVPAHLRVCVRHFDLDLRPVAVTLARSVVAALATCAALLVIGDTDLGVAEWIGGALAAPLMYLSVLLVLGEFSPADLARLPRRRRP